MFLRQRHAQLFSCSSGSDHRLAERSHSSVMRALDPDLDNCFEAETLEINVSVLSGGFDLVNYFLLKPPWWSQI